MLQITALTAAVSALETTATELQNAMKQRIATLEGELTAANLTISQLQAQNAALKEHITAMETEDATDAAALDALRARVDAVTAAVTEMQAQVS